MGPARDLSRAASLAGIGLLFVSLAHGLGAQSAVADRTVWDGAYTDAQAERGRTVFTQSCAGCHALASEGQGPLVGEAFWDGFTQKTIGQLLTYVSTSMPNGPGAGLLPASSYHDVVALILKSNGLPSGSTELAARTMADVQIVPKDGSSELPSGALARVVGCLAPKSGADWVLTRATAPERVETSTPGADDGSRSLGERTIALKFVLTRLDNLVGHRVSASGLLMGPGGADGLNVMGVTSVAGSCP